MSTKKSFLRVRVHTTDDMGVAYYYALIICSFDNCVNKINHSTHFFLNKWHGLLSSAACFLVFAGTRHACKKIYHCCIRKLVDPQERREEQSDLVTPQPRNPYPQIPRITQSTNASSSRSGKVVAECDNVYFRSLCPVMCP